MDSIGANWYIETCPSVLISLTGQNKPSPVTVRGESEQMLFVCSNFYRKKTLLASSLGPTQWHKGTLMDKQLAMDGQTFFGYLMGQCWCWRRWCLLPKQTDATQTLTRFNICLWFHLVSFQKVSGEKCKPNEDGFDQTVDKQVNSTVLWIWNDKIGSKQSTLYLGLSIFNCSLWSCLSSLGFGVKWTN